MKTKLNSFNTKETMMKTPPRLLNFQHTLSRMMTGPTGLGKRNGLENCYFPRKYNRLRNKSYCVLDNFSPCIKTLCIDFIPGIQGYINNYQLPLTLIALLRVA